MSPFLAAIFLLGLCQANAVNFTTVYEWDEFDFIWPSGADTSIGQIKDEYKPGNVEFNYMAVFGERLFLSLDANPGIPATLVWLPTSVTSTAPPKLAPFPSWHLHLHKTDNCETIQEAKGMETDADGQLWVLDDGSSDCSSKIWIFNLLNNDTTEHVHQFPDTVVSHLYNERHLRDIVLDKTQDDYLAYITESESEHIIVYSRKMDKSWSVKTPGSKWISLALSPKKGQLYLARYGSNGLYSVPVSELNNEGGSAAVKFIGKWDEEPYRMLIDSANVLYAAFQYANYLSKWNISEPAVSEQRFHEVGELDAGWPFTFALDTNGSLWITERNETQGKTRHKLLKAAVGATSYLYSTSTASTTPQASAFSMNTILIWLLVCCVSCLVLSCTVNVWLSLRMRRMRNSLKQISLDNNRAEMSVFPEDPLYDDVGPENSNEESTPENPVEPLYAEVDPDYASARTTSREPYEEPIRLGNTNAGQTPSEEENIYDDVGPGPSPGPSRNKNSGRRPTESVQYLEVLP